MSYKYRQFFIVQQLSNISVDNECNKVIVYFTPTIPNCTYYWYYLFKNRQAAVIGLCIRVKLDRCLPRRLKSRVYITPGTHNTEDSLNRQINDKERVSAALENPSLYILFDFHYCVTFISVSIIEKCIVDTDFVDVDHIVEEFKRSLQGYFVCNNNL